jgi:hypothetical protein
MDLLQFARAIDLAALAFVFGATCWFFFVQSPLLLQKLGRDRFVPIQMRLTRVLFQLLAVLLLFVLCATAVHSPVESVSMVTAGVAALGGLVNHFVIVPRALRAGGRSRADIKGKDHQATTTSFASEGAGARTAILHRLVVLFVVVMLVGVVGHGAVLLGL